MKMHRNFLYFLLIALLAFGCTSDEKKTPSGLVFKVLKKGDGILPKKGEIVVLDYVLKDNKDSVWANTWDNGIPTANEIADSAMLSQENGLTQMLRLTSKGDSISTKMSITKFFTDIVGGNVPFGLDTTLQLTYYVSIRNIMPREEFRTYQVRLVNARQKRQLAKEITNIKEYLEVNKLQATQDTSGLFYTLHKVNSGAQKPELANCVTISYEGKLLKDGQKFDANQNLKYPLQGFIQGWQIGLPKMGVGDSATLYVPSTLGYGPQGYSGVIPRDATLIFNIKLESISEMDTVKMTCK